MRIFLASLIMLLVELAFGAVPADPDKPLYQWKGLRPPGNMWLLGRCYEVEPPKVQDESVEAAEMRITIEKMEDEARNEAETRESGHRCMRIGVWCLVFGGITALVLAHYGFELLGLFVAVGGVGSIIYGAVTIKMVEHISGIAIGAVCAFVIGIIVWLWRGKGIQFKALWRTVRGKVPIVDQQGKGKAS